MNTTHHHKTHKRFMEAFSLPEVAIAVAIAALGFVSVLGLIPTGLDNMREAGESIATSRVYQQMFNELQQADWGDPPSGSGAPTWDKLMQYHDAVRYFDGEGTPINMSDANFGMNISYVAQFKIFNQDTPLPGSTGNAVRRDMRRVQVHIATTTNPSYNFSSANPLNSQWRAFTITRQF